MRGLLLSVWAAGCVGTTGKGDGYDDGCQDGTDFGYSNGLLHGENCEPYNDSPDERAVDTADPYDVSYNEGYADCYPQGYSDGYTEGSTAANGGAGCP